MWLLLAQNPVLISHLRPHYDKTGATLFQNSQSFTDLLPIFLGMLKDADLGRVFIVLDALDECKGPIGQYGGLGRDIFDLLNELLKQDKAMSKIKILITTRPLIEIDTMMRGLDQDPNDTINLDKRSLAGPINLYIDHQRPALVQQAEGNIVAEEAIKELKKNPGRTFIWVHLVCDQLLQSNPGQWKQTLEDAPLELEKLYFFLLGRLNAPAQSRWFGYCKKVILLVMLAYRPLTLKEMEAFIDPPRDISLAKLVQECRSFVIIQQDTVFPIHKSAIDYLRKNHEFLDDNPFDKLHHAIFERALRILMDNLKRNMYDLVNHGVLIEEAKAPETTYLHSIGYFCQYWIDHLKASRLQDSSLKDSPLKYSPLQDLDISNLDKFFHVHFLHWLEALSLLHILPVAMDTVNDVHSLLPQGTDGNLSQFVIDAKRFLAKFSPIIAEAPLQTYVSTLVFAPEKSKVRETFQDEKPHWVSRVRPSDTTWSPLIRSIKTLEYDRYTSVAVSPKGDIMVAASMESADVFNMATGTLVRRLKTDWLWHVSFSPCGELLAMSARYAKTVDIWDTSKWKHIKALIHSDEEPLACAFSPRGGVLATASSTKITLWELATEDVFWLRCFRLST
ncbi:unnamed protein product [Penicillium salamii]|uniref:Nephrocystin 3-like N-terminal domain-containing protein n=1 Tax=Penicillium salamii TaxID=1612424 RepID=A0A9W4NHK8_9EURO|nr:unnamed protein product [Penicillium salamii]